MRIYRGFVLLRSVKNGEWYCRHEFVDDLGRVIGDDCAMTAMEFNGVNSTEEALERFKAVILNNGGTLEDMERMISNSDKSAFSVRIPLRVKA